MGQEMPARLWLVPLSGELRRFELPQCESVTRIGRDPSTNDVIPGEAHAYVSRDHCRIRSNLAATGQVVLEDLSGNGTYVNGTRVERGYRMRLKCGDQISLAKPWRRGGALHFLLAKPTQLVHLS